jgi:hypothetical protein
LATFILINKAFSPIEELVCLPFLISISATTTLASFSAKAIAVALPIL